MTVQMRRLSIVMEALGTLDDYGRPVDWAVHSTVEEDWGTLKLYCGTEDVTNFRGVPAEITSYRFKEPFAYGPAEVAFPQISSYDTLGEGDLDWFVQGMNVTIKKLDPDGETETNVWEGLAASWEHEQDDRQDVMRLHCMGLLDQANLEPMPPMFEPGLMDVGWAIKNALDGVPARRWAALPTVVTTRGTRNPGAWQGRLDYVQDILSTAYNADGTLQWTVGCDPGRFPTLHIKDRTTVNWHATVGQQGTVLRESSDVTGSVNVIYGEGIRTDGGRWRNTRYPSVDEPVFVPLIGVSENMPYLYDSEGNASANPSFDSSRLRVARYENYGSDISLSEGVDAASAELIRDVNPGWYGTFEMITDPEEGSRFDVRAGDNIALRHHHGDPTRLFHVVEVEVLVKELKVTLTIDTNARDSITLAGIRARDREAATDPARRLNPPRRKSRQTPDQRPVFDAENGAGLLSPTSLVAETWKVVRVAASRYGTMSSTEITTSSPHSRFAVGVFGKAVTSSDLDSLVGSGGTIDWDTQADDLSDAGLLMAWGDNKELAGFYPKRETDTPTPSVTGRLVDDDSWDFVSQSEPWLWVAIIAEDDCTVSGRFYLAPEG